MVPSHLLVQSTPGPCVRWFYGHDERIVRPSMSTISKCSHTDVKTVDRRRDRSRLLSREIDRLAQEPMIRVYRT